MSIFGFGKRLEGRDRQYGSADEGLQRRDLLSAHLPYPAFMFFVRGKV